MTNESTNFNIASFLSSIILESYNNNVNKELIENPKQLLKMKVNKKANELKNL